MIAENPGQRNPTSYWLSLSRNLKWVLRGQTNRAVEGFALIDVLVGLTLAGVLSALMIMFLGQARTIGRLNADAEIRAELEAVTNYLETTIAAVEPIALADSSPDQRYYLQGTSQSLRFSTVQPIGFKKAGLQEVVLSMSAGAENEGRLEVSARARFGFAETGPQMDPIVLLSGVRAFKLEYLEAGQGGPAWSGAWDQPGALPLAVRFTVTADRGGKLYQATGLATLGLAQAHAVHNEGPAYETSPP